MFRCPPDRVNSNKRIAYGMGADKSGWDLTQRLRVPGTPNHKYPGKPLVRLVSVDDRACDPDDLDRLLPLVEDVADRRNGHAEPIGTAGVEPPVRLSPRGLQRWSGELTDGLSRGGLDRSRGLFMLGLDLAEAGAAVDTIAASLAERDAALGWNKHASRPDAAERYREIAEKAVAWAAKQTAVIRDGSTGEPPSPDSVRSVIATFRRWFHLPDAGPLEVVLGAMAANFMQGDPVWLMLVGPPSGGKTEILQSATRLPNVHLAATITEAALLSGTPKKEAAAGAKGGLLKVIGEFGFIVAKDFTSVLSMNRDARAALLAALREVYDGSWTRHIGADGGRTLSWSGKIGLLAGCTPTIDSHHAVMAAMGERFLLYRQPTINPVQQAGRALDHVGREAEMRAELADAVAGLFANLSLPPVPPPLESREQDRLIALATLAARCRSAVERDPYRREIELISEPEAPGRLALMLSRLLAGMTAIGIDRDEAWRVTVEAALDCMPAVRRTVLEALARNRGGWPSAKELAAAVGYPLTTTRRVLEDLLAPRVVMRSEGSGNDSDVWALAGWVRKIYDALVAQRGVSDLASNEISAS